MLKTLILVLTAFSANPPTNVVNDKVECLVESCQLKSKGLAYCQKITASICQSGKELNVDPLIVAVTAYHESRFSMASRPQMGIMQFTRSTWRSNFGPQGHLLKGLDPKKPEHNIRAGTAYLRGHLLSSRGSVRGMWLKYNQGHAQARNGAYHSTAYTRQAERTLSRLRTWSLPQLRKYLSSGKEL